MEFSDLMHPLLKAMKSSLTGEVVEKSLDYNSGLEIKRENPDSLIGKLSETVQLYDTMMLDDRIAMAIRIKKSITLSVNRSIISGSEDDKDEEIAEEVRKQLGLDSSYRHEHGYTFDQLIKNALDAMVYGYMVGEKVWTLDNGKIKLFNIKWRHPILFDFDYDEWGNFDKILIGYRYGDVREVDRKEIDNKFVVLTWPYVEKGNVYGVSELADVYRQWRSKQHIQKQRDVFLEKWGQPVPVVTYVSNEINVAEKQAIQDMLDNWQEGTYAIIPGKRNAAGDITGKFKLELIEVKTGSGSDQFENAIDQLDKQITRAMLFPDKLGFSESPGGSYNLAEQQFDILLSVVEDCHRWVEDFINNQVIRQIVDFNFSNVEKYPELRFDRLTDKIKPEMLNILINAGVVNPGESWIRQHVGIPEISDEEKEELKPDDSGEPESTRPSDNKPSDNVLPKDKAPEKNELKKLIKTGANPFKFQKVEAWMDVSSRSFARDYIDVMKQSQDIILKKVTKLYPDAKAISNIEIPKGMLRKMITQHFAEWYLTGMVDGENEIRPRVKIEKMKRSVNLKAEGLTSIDGKNQHAHSYILDDYGDGQTTTTNGEEKPHIHNVINYKVVPYDNHNHELENNPEAKKFIDDDTNYLDRSYIDNFLLKETEWIEVNQDVKEKIKIIRERGFVIAGDEEARVIKKVNEITASSIRSGDSLAVMSAKIARQLDADRRRYADTLAKTYLSEHYNNGRMSTFQQNFIRPLIAAYQYQAIIDGATTEYCKQHDGQIIRQGDPQVFLVNPPNHFNCRSVLVPIMVGEDEVDGYFKNWENESDPWGTNISGDAVNPAKGFGG